MTDVIPRAEEHEASNALLLTFGVAVDIRQTLLGRILHRHAGLLCGSIIKASEYVHRDIYLLFAFLL